MKNMNWIASNKEKLILLIILFIATILRLHQIDAPLADFHSWRQVESANIAQVFVSVDGGIAEQVQALQNTTHYVEFPFYNYLFAQLHLLFPPLTLATSGRIVSVLFSLLTISSVYYLTKKESSQLTAVVASSTFAIFPFFVYFSRTILPEVPAVALAITSIALCHRSLTEGTIWRQYLLISCSALCFSLGVMTKPTALIFILPIFFLFLRTYELRITKKPLVYLFVLITVFPVFTWLSFLNFPTILPGDTSLFATIYTAQGEEESILFSPLYLRTIIFERITNVILGGLMLFPLAVGLITKKQPFLFISIGISSLFFLLLFQGGNLLFTYYQILILPSLAIYIGLGINTLWKEKNRLISPMLLIPFMITIMSLSVFFSYSTVRSYYAYSDDLIRIARIINTLTQPEDRIVTDQNGDTTLLYLANREGTASFEDELNTYIQDGYDYLLTSNTDKMASIKQQNIYSIVFQNDQFILFRL